MPNNISPFNPQLQNNVGLQLKLKTVNALQSLSDLEDALYEVGEKLGMNTVVFEILDNTIELLTKMNKELFTEQGGE